MAQFRGTIQGSRGTTSRLGHKTTGLHVTCDGWDTGIEIEAVHENGKDVFYVYKTGGSNGLASTVKVATVSGGDLSLPACK